MLNLAEFLKALRFDFALYSLILVIGQIFSQLHRLDATRSQNRYRSEQLMVHIFELLLNSDRRPRCLLFYALAMDELRDEGCGRKSVRGFVVDIAVLERRQVAHHSDIITIQFDFGSK